MNHVGKKISMYIIYAKGTVSFLYNILYQGRWGKVNFHERKNKPFIDNAAQITCDTIKYHKSRYFYLVYLIFISA